MRVLPLLAVGLLALAPPAAAQVYDPATLAAERPRVAARIAELHGLLTRPEFLPPDGAWLARVPVQVPDVAPNGDPLGFMSDGRTVVMPLAGLKFIEDLTMAYAWRHRARRSLEPMDEYLAMLRWKPERDWPGGRYLDPLTALGVPPLVWERDPASGELGTRLRNEAWAFILAHELGHLYHRHPGSRLPPPQVQENEREADAFALAVMERSDTIPMGAILYFQATAAFYPSRADLPSDEAYARWQREEATHPMNARRLRAIAQALQLRSRREGDPTRGEALHFIGGSLEEIAVILDDPAMQQLIVRRAVYQDPVDLRDR